MCRADPLPTARVRIELCIGDHQELHGELVGPDGVSHHFAGWMQLVTALEDQRAHPLTGRSARWRPT
jgi:hypothetical protein